MFTVKLKQVHLSSLNPRQIVGDDLSDLAASIKSVGVLQPISVRLIEDDHWECILGSRRVRAASLAGLREIPAIDLGLISDQTALELMLVENCQREDVLPTEEAQGFQRLSELGLTHAKIAERIGKSESYVRERLKLLTLCPLARNLLDTRQITPGHGAYLSRLSVEDQEQFASLCVEKDLSVRELALHINEASPDLVAAPFDLTDETLAPRGSCVGCPFNSACDGTLFHDEDSSSKGMCLDPSCFEEKVAEHRRRVAEQMAAQTGRVVVKDRQELPRLDKGWYQAVENPAKPPKEAIGVLSRDGQSVEYVKPYLPEKAADDDYMKAQESRDTVGKRIADHRLTIRERVEARPYPDWRVFIMALCEMNATIREGLFTYYRQLHPEIKKGEVASKAKRLPLYLAMGEAEARLVGILALENLESTKHVCYYSGPEPESPVWEWADQLTGASEPVQMSQPSAEEPNLAPEADTAPVALNAEAEAPQGEEDAAPSESPTPPEEQRDSEPSLPGNTEPNGQPSASSSDGGTIDVMVAGSKCLVRLERHAKESGGKQYDRLTITRASGATCSQLFHFESWPTPRGIVEAIEPVWDSLPWTKPGPAGNEQGTTKGPAGDQPSTPQERVKAKARQVVKR